MFFILTGVAIIYSYFETQNLQANISSIFYIAFDTAMDSHYLGFGVAGAGLSYSSYSTAAASVPTSNFGSSKFDLIRYSPDSRFSTYFDSLDQYSSMDHNLSEPTTFSTSSLDYQNNYLQQLGPLIHSGSFDQDGNDDQQMRRALQELESALFATDDDADVAASEPFIMPSRDFIPPYTLKELLIACARALSEDKLNEFESLIEHARGAVSISGEPIQRLGAYMVEGLIARKESSGTNICRALKCDEPDSKDHLSYMHTLYKICPYFKFGYMAANGAIAEACRNEDRIHIIDFQIVQGTQWMTLLQALASRPGGPPHVRISGIDDPVSNNAKSNSLGKRFSAISEKFNIPIEFHHVPVLARNVTKEMLGVRPDEALAVNFPLQLHHTPDESVDVSNPRDGLLRMVRSLSPKVVTLVEQESNTNTAPFVQRFVETLDYYSAMFESVSIGMARDSQERINVEKHCLARDIVNVIACEGKERVERHEVLGKWRSRLTMAGFRPFRLSCYVNSVIRGLLRCYSEHYTLVEKDGAMLLGWKDRGLISASAWH